MTTIEANSADILAYCKANNEPAWFKNQRLQAKELAPTLPLPNFEKIRYQRWPIHLTKDLVNPQVTPNETLNNLKTKNCVVQQADRIIWQDVTELTQQGVVICDWQTALAKHPQLIEEYFMTKATKLAENQLNAEHVAQLTSGLLIYVPKNVILTKPLTTYFVQDAQVQQDYVHHVLIIADDNSEFSYLENLLTVGQEQATANIIVEVIAKPNSHIKFASVDRLGKNTTTYLNRRGYLQQDAKIDWSLGMMNDGNIVGDFDSELVGDGSHAEVKVIAISTGKQFQGIDTRVTNYGRHSIGNILQHGVILEKSNLVFNGIGHIIKGAKRANAQQESRVLMLSKRGRGDANPILLIDDNDVVAGHAASVGRIDEEKMYYLMSRGLPEKLAQRLVIRGFLGSVLKEIPSRDVQVYLEQMIERKLIDGQKDF